jgi:hypothetical protein
MDTGWLVALSTVAIALVGAIMWRALRVGIVAVVEKSVASKFDKQLEAVRSDLRSKEAKITALQSAALSGRAGRQAMLDKRRVEALETLWDDVIALNAFIWPAKMTELLELDAIAKNIGNDPAMQKFMEVVGGRDLTEKLKLLKGESARLFVPQEVWNLYSAYKGLLIYCYMRIKGAVAGMGDKMFKDEGVVEDIKKVIPHFSEYLDKYGITGAAGLSNILRESTFESIKLTLNNLSVDQNEIQGIHDVMDKISKIGERA